MAGADKHDPKAYSTPSLPSYMHCGMKAKEFFFAIEGVVLSWDGCGGGQTGNNILHKCQTHHHLNNESPRSTSLQHIETIPPSPTRYWAWASLLSGEINHLFLVCTTLSFLLFGGVSFSLSTTKFFLTHHERTRRYPQVRTLILATHTPLCIVTPCSTLLPFYSHHTPHPRSWRDKLTTNITG